ncbi:unnamed protein product [Calypogeia fissa]
MLFIRLIIYLGDCRTAFIPSHLVSLGVSNDFANNTHYTNSLLESYCGCFLGFRLSGDGSWALLCERQPVL